MKGPESAAGRSKEHRMLTSSQLKEFAPIVASWDRLLELAL